MSFSDPTTIVLTVLSVVCLSASFWVLNVARAKLDEAILYFDTGAALFREAGRLSNLSNQGEKE